MTENNHDRQRKLLMAAVILLLLSGALYLLSRYVQRNDADESLVGQDNALEQIQPEDDQEREVEAVVADFGHRLKDVSLLSPTAPQDIESNYQDLVATTLISQWKANPSQAPGRLTSSPWPDEIIIEEIIAKLDGTYEVTGRLVSATSDGVSGEQAIGITVSPEGDSWLISQVTIEEQEDENDKVVYSDSQYGFAFALPESWTGYSVITAEWQGQSIEGEADEYEEGPIITLRHPDWKSDSLRQDIPIMVFTTKQWNDINADKFHIGAAPINPRELGRNTSYVFALPARYNFAFPEGYQEVEQIIEGNPLTPIEN